MESDGAIHWFWLCLWTLVLQFIVDKSFESCDTQQQKQSLEVVYKKVCFEKFHKVHRKNLSQSPLINEVSYRWCLRLQYSTGVLM